MNPGRELDALVAEKVMGWKRLPQCEHLHPENEISDRHTLCHCFPDYSTDIAAAMEVLQVVYRRTCFRQQEFMRFSEGDGWEVTIHRPDLPPVRYCHSGSLARGKHDLDVPSLPYAICLAALKAVGIEVPK